MTPLDALLEHEGTKSWLRAPTVGLWRGGPRLGQILRTGDALGQIETLGRLFEVRVPEGVLGEVVERSGLDRSRAPVGYKTLLAVVEAEGLGAKAEAAEAAFQAEAEQGSVIRAPLHGRFYLRPGVGKAPFVEVGSVVELGHTVALIEVMKTFNRVQYGGPDLPARARVKAVLRKDDEEVEQGTPLFEVEAVE